MKWYNKYTNIEPNSFFNDYYVGWSNEYKYSLNAYGPQRLWKSGSEEWYKNNTRELHREDGPACIYFGTEASRNNVYEERWFINYKNITKEVEAWIKEHNYPNWQEWDDVIKMHFKLTFVG